jgi:hypothetical protein
MNGRIKIVTEILKLAAKMSRDFFLNQSTRPERYRSHRGDLNDLHGGGGVSLKVEWQPHKSHHHQTRKASNKLVIDSSGFRWEREHVTAAGTVRVCHRVCQGW